jgi:hypothetical protein
MRRYLLRQWYKLFVYSTRWENKLHGKFRVVYPDGNVTEKMCWSNAKSYKEIYGGKIIDAF